MFQKDMAVKRHADHRVTLHMFDSPVPTALGWGPSAPDTPRANLGGPTPALKEKSKFKKNAKNTENACETKSENKGTTS